MIQKEIGLKVEDFMGVNRLVTRDQIQDHFFWSLQNLYERKIGELQRRGGASVITATAVPSNITSMDQDFVIYDKFLGKSKLLKVGCTDAYPQPSALISAPAINFAQVTMSFLIDATAKWGQTPAGVTGSFVGCTGIKLVATGFGVNNQINTTLVAGLPVAGDTKKLRVVIASSLLNTNITGIEVYATVQYGNGSPTDSGDIFIGFIDLIATPTGTFDFKNGPITLTGTSPATGAIGDIDATYSLVGTTGGTLTPGKTYYIALLSHTLHWNNATDGKYYTTWYAGKVTAITLTGAQNAIFVSKSGAGTTSSMVAVGTHPYLLKPLGVVSNASTFDYNVNSLVPDHCCAVVKFSPTSTAVNAGTWTFRFSDFGVDEMFAKVDSNGNWINVPISNYSGANAYQIYSNWNGYDYGLRTTISSGSKWNGKQYISQTQEMLFMTPESSWASDFLAQQRGSDTRGSALNPSHNITISDGYAVTLAPMDFGCASPPRFAYVGYYKETVLGMGGSGTARNQMYFANAYSPFNWGVPGASTTAQYVQLESAGEDILGSESVNIITYTGPIEELLVGKRSSLWLLTDLPVYTSGSNNNAKFIELSRKAGCANNKCFVKTEVGTIVAGIDNVWLVSKSGEPTPIGDEIKWFLKSEDPTVTADCSRWSLTYHQDHVKLAYSLPGSSVPNQELWLSINKMKKLEGQPCWYGPMVGRETSGSVVELQFNDTIIPKRWSVDSTNLRWYQADREDVTTDFGTNLSFLIESKNFGMQDDMLNKLPHEYYYKLKVDTAFSFSETIKALGSQGETSDTQTRAVSPITGYAASTYLNFAQNCRSKLYRFFPSRRDMVGENFTLSWSYTGAAFFTFAGFGLFHSMLRRRPG